MPLLHRYQKRTYHHKDHPAGEEGGAETTDHEDDGAAPLVQVCDSHDGHQRHPGGKEGEGEPSLHGRGREGEDGYPDSQQQDEGDEGAYQMY